MDESLYQTPDLAERIAERLRHDIRSNCKQGQKLDSVRTFCQRFEVSTNTVRAALKILQREGLIEMWHGSGSFVKEIAPPSEVGVVMEFDVGDVTSSFFFRRVATQVRRELEEQGCLTRFYNGFLIPGEPGAIQARDFPKDVKDRRLSGVVILGGESYGKCIDELRRQRIPIVGAAPSFDASVTHDYQEMVRAGTLRLLEAGRRKLALMGWCEPAGRHQPMDAREIFESILSEHGVAVRPEWIRTDLHPSAPGAGWSGFREIMASSMEKPDGLLVCDDMLFMDAIPAVVASGLRVPEQMLIVTHAVAGARTYCPFQALRMEYDPDSFAAALASALLELMQGRALKQSRMTQSFRWSDRDAGRKQEPMNAIV